MYGKMKIELTYFLHAMFVLVTRKATIPPKRMETIQVPMARRTVLRSGIQRFVRASLLVKRSV